MKSSANLVPILTHDMNNHLSATQSYLELFLSGTLDEAQNISLAKNLFDLTKNTSIMLANLMCWSKILSKESLCRSQHLMLADILSQIVADQQSIAQNKKIRLDLKLRDDISVLGDSIYLPLVLRNLVNNAIKFTPEYGMVLITTTPAEGEIHLHIQDTGIGISMERQKQLFSLEWETTYGTRNEKGLGLGLWLCKELLDRQKGRIWCQSVIGEGTTFGVAIPLP
jgi:signal transduction histidine kinase